MIVLRNKEYSFKTTQAIAKGKLLLNRLRKNKKSRQTILREAIDLQNKKVIPTAAKIKTKVDAAKLKSVSPIASVAEATHGTAKLIAQKPGPGILATPVSTVITANALTKAGMNAATAVPVAEGLTLSGAVFLNKIVGGTRDGLRKLGWRLSRSNNKDTARLGYRLNKGVRNLMKANKGYQNSVGTLFDRPGYAIKSGIRSAGRGVNYIYNNPIPAAKRIISAPFNGIMNTSQFIGDAAVVGTRPVRQTIINKTGLNNLASRAKGYIPSFRIPEPTFELAPGRLAGAGF